MARASARMDFTGADEAPEGALNEAIWKNVRGAQSAMPRPRHALPAVDR